MWRRQFEFDWRSCTRVLAGWHWLSVQPHCRSILVEYGTCRMRCVVTYYGLDGRHYAKITVTSRRLTHVAQANVEVGVTFGDDLIRKALATSLVTQTEAFVYVTLHDEQEGRRIDDTDADDESRTDDYDK